jgi:uncharacterized protein (DUF2236 family)
MARLRRAQGRRAGDLSRGLFTPASVTWRVHREAAVLLGGGRALLLQVAHPLVAAGVGAHSRFRSAPLERLRRTLDLMLTLVFADAAGTLRAVGEIERVHARVHGVLAADVGPFPSGTPYDANDPRLLFWVHATLVDSALGVYQRFVRPLSPAARVAYYDESKRGARLLGIPERLIPRTLGAFDSYMRRMIASDVLTVGPVGRDVAASILRPPVPFGLGVAFRAVNFVTVGLLPPALRDRFGLAWSPRREQALRMLATLTRVTLPLAPACVRVLPQARRAERAARRSPR